MHSLQHSLVLHPPTTHRPRCPAVPRALPRGVSKPRVKICGVTDVEDARCALDKGADLLGMILWPKAKRCVSHETAVRITSLARSYPTDKEGFPKVAGVFVDEDADQITKIKERTNIDLVQLHGDIARESLPSLHPELPKIYVLHVDPEGTSEDGLESPVDYVLVDGMKGGSGVRFPLEKLQLPEWVHDRAVVKHGWLLAGGLNPENVSSALRELHGRQMFPIGVDVSSGVCNDGGLRKSPEKIEQFLRQARPEGTFTC